MVRLVFPNNTVLPVDSRSEVRAHAGFDLEQASLRRYRVEGVIAVPADGRIL